MYGIIYKATNLNNAKMYIGQTTYSMKTRQLNHFKKADTPTTKFHHAINKYGKNNFKWEIIDSADSKEELNQKEILWIETLNTYKNGYNSTIGGDTTTGYCFSEESKQKISNSNKGKQCTKNNAAWKDIDNKKLLDLYNESYEWQQIEKYVNLESRAIIRHLGEILNISEKDIKRSMKNKKIQRDYKCLCVRATELNYILLTTIDEYQSGLPYPSKMYLQIQCTNNHVFTMRASAFLSQKYKCPICSKSSYQYQQNIEKNTAQHNL